MQVNKNLMKRIPLSRHSQQEFFEGCKFVTPHAHFAFGQLLASIWLAFAVCNCLWIHSRIRLKWYLSGVLQTTNMYAFVSLRLPLNTSQCITCRILYSPCILKEHEYSTGGETCLADPKMQFRNTVGVSRNSLRLNLCLLLFYTGALCGR